MELSILAVILYALIFIIALLLIALILVQPSKSGGFGASFGGVGESIFGGQAGSHLTKMTVWMTSLFFLLALLLAVVIGRDFGQSSKSSGVENELKTASVPVQSGVVADALEKAAGEAEAQEGRRN